MTVANLPEDEFDEYVELLTQLIHSFAETARLDAYELREAGFSPIEVVGMKSVVWIGDNGLYTTEAALEEIRPGEEE